MTDEQLKEKYRETARSGYCQFDANDISVDSNAEVSIVREDDGRGNGAWVHAWVWLYEPDNVENI